MIVCVAVVGPQNNPLFLRVRGGAAAHAVAGAPPPPPRDEAPFHYIVHCALDAVEEKVLLRRTPGDGADAYLGLLYPTEEYRVFGYISNSHAKFVLVLDEPAPRDDELGRIFRRLHALYADATCNPFYTYGAPLTALSFRAGVESVLSSYVPSAS